MHGTPEEEQLNGLLEEYHGVFSLSKGDRGETVLIELHIDTGVPSALSSLCSKG